MCTVSWIHHEDGYTLLCNRDEQRSRGLAQPAMLHRLEGVACIAPTDSDFGGTWIGVNEFGVAVCLLNGANLLATPAGKPAGSRSRGLLVRDLLPSGSIEEAAGRLGRADGYAAFTVVILEPGHAAFAAQWDGATLHAVPDADGLVPLVSSTVATEQVQAARRNTFTRFQGDAGAMRAFHASHEPLPGPLSPCMHRPDAETLSFSEVYAGSSRVEFAYTPGSPCKGLPRTTTTMPRVAICCHS